jgi:hypothetical protein
LNMVARGGSLFISTMDGSSISDGDCAKIVISRVKKQHTATLHFFNNDD